LVKLKSKLESLQARVGSAALISLQFRGMRRKRFDAEWVIKIPIR
jgi:hypothetical protein